MNIKGLILSYLLLILLLLISTLLNKHKILKQEHTRKLIHIGISNWWIIAMFYFNNYLIASIVPLTFIILNFLSYKYKIVKAIERRDRNDLGTVYYPISLFILVILFFGYIKTPYIGAIGSLIMGYGDGFTAIIGSKYGKNKIYKNKTLEGSITMFVISFIVTFIVLFIYNPYQIFIASITIAFLATILELFSKKGLDNLTVPLMSALFYYLIFFI